MVPMFLSCSKSFKTLLNINDEKNIVIIDMKNVSMIDMTAIVALKVYC